MSRAIFDAPTITPASLRIGGTVSDHVLLVLPIGRNQHADRLADHLRGGVAERPLGGDVPRSDDAVDPAFRSSAHLLHGGTMWFIRA
ncbi:MAG TPA: hypothetical protein VKD69_07445 [Vicinamibacterales bacterium]|nr:hypothetical protein [Vicinamibacterales bacterium]